MSSRRIFVQQSVSSLGAILLIPQLVAPSCFASRRANDSPGSELALSLFFDDADLPRMRSIYETDPAFISLKERLNAVDRKVLWSFIKNDVRHNDQLFDIVRLSDAAQEMGMHYLMTGDRDAADLSAACVREIMKFDRWDYFLEAGKDVVGIQRASSTMVSVAVCADWLGDFIESDERTQWLMIMKERGLDTCFRSIYGMRYPETVTGWTRDETSTYFEHRPEDRPTDLSRRHIILDTTNLKAVPASALAIGAIAYKEFFGSDEDTERWIEQAVFSLSSFKEFFTEDGSYHEGVSYANYTALNIIKATSILKRFDAADLTEIINWPGYANFAIGMSMPTADDPYEIVNFGDNGNAKGGNAAKPKRTAVALWVGSTFDDPRSQWYGLNLGGVHDEWALMWYDPALAPQAPPSGPQVYHSDLDWMVARTGYKPDDLTVAMRSGGPGNHEHADRGSIIVKAYGEQLVADPYRPPYSFTDPKWMMRTTAGHSAVLIDGAGHQYHDGREGTNASQAVARIIREVEGKGFAYWTSDATPAYQMVNPDIDSVTRTVFVQFDFPGVIVFDKLVKRSTASVLQARFFGFNYDGDGSVAAKGSGFTMQRPLARLDGIASSTLGSAASSLHLPIPQDEAKKHPFAEVATVMPSLTPSLVTVLMPTSSAAGSLAATARIEHADGTYAIRMSRGMMEFNCRFHDAGAVPEIEIG